MRKRRLPQIIAGRVNGSTPAIIAASGDFTVTKVGVGQWTIIFPSSFRAISIVAQGESAYEFWISRIETNGTATVATSGTAGGGSGAVDATFEFVAVGIQE